ncbi:MAG: class I SAM-dependent methyltransferase [Hyphomicrobiaceae bacterium]
MNKEINGGVVFTHEQVKEYSTIELVGQYLLAAHLINSKLSERRDKISTLVDFGSGAGKSTRAIAPSVRAGGRIIGVDISDEFVSEARIITGKSTPRQDIEFDYRKINIVNGREVIPLDDQSVDAVTSTIVLQELQTEAQLRGALSEMGRIAKTGAHLALVCVSDKIVRDDFTAFTYAPFPENAGRDDNIRKCLSTVSNIVWENDRHWSSEALMSGLKAGGWGNLKAEYPLATEEMRPFPSRPELGWKDEVRVAPLVLISGCRL